MATGFTRTPLAESIQYHYDILCDICDESHVASWSCNTCGQNLCETCKRNHQKISFTKNHPILPLLDRHESKGGHGILCTHHQEPILFFCDCQEETCRKCQSEAHRGHKSQDIAVHAKRIRNDIEKEFESKKRSIVDAREKVGSLQDEKQEFDYQSETDIERVKKTLDGLFKNFREQAKSLIKDVESRLEKSEDDFKSESSSAGRELDEAEIEMNELLAAYRRQPDAGLWKYWKENLQPKIQNVKIDVKISFDRIVFSESQFDKHIDNIKSDVVKLTKCFKEEKIYEQTLYKRNSWPTETDVAKALKQSFTLEGEVTIYSLSVVHTEQIQLVWIGLCRKEAFRVELFTADGECLRHKSINFPPLYLSSLQQNAKKDTSPQADDVLITSGVQSSFIRILKGDGFLADFKDVTPFFPFGMCCSSDGHVFVCLQKSEFAGKVIQLTMTGEVVKEFFLHNCFTPTRIMNTPSGVIVKNDCSLINLKGNTFVKLNTDDCVSSVCCDARGNIFGAGIKDSNESCVIRVHKKSKVTFPLPFVGTCFVADIACDIHNNVLWVASSDGNIQAVGTDFFMREK